MRKETGELIAVLIQFGIGATSLIGYYQAGVHHSLTLFFACMIFALLRVTYKHDKDPFSIRWGGPLFGTEKDSGSN